MNLAVNERWRVIHGDCREVLPKLGQVDHVITDPPYSDWTHSKNRGNPLAGRAALKEIEFPAITQVEREFCALEFQRLARRWVIAWTDFEGISGWVSAVCSAQLEHIRCGVWIKGGCAPQMSGDRPGTGAECAIIAHRPGRKRWNGGGLSAVWHHNIAALEGSKEHTTQKPLSLMLELVELFTDPGDLVLDPFCGSGTTGVACLRLGRRFIGIERDAKYYQVAVDRLKAEERGLTLRDARAGQTSIFDAMGGEP